MDRSLLSDAQGQRVAPLLPGKSGDPGRSAADNRRFLEAVLWLVRTGSPWRDRDPKFGGWNSVFRRWAQKGVFERVFEVLAGDPDFEDAVIDGTIVRVHRQQGWRSVRAAIGADRRRRQQGTGAKGKRNIRPSTAEPLIRARQGRRSSDRRGAARAAA